MKKSKSSIQPMESTEEQVRGAVQEIIRKFALEAVWPSTDRKRIKNLITMMAIEISGTFGRTIDDVSIEDVSRAQQAIEKICGKVGIHKIKMGKVKTAIDLYKNVGAVYEYSSHIYWLGNLFFGNFGPMVGKLGLKVSGPQLARVVGVWLAGQAILELYWDLKGYQKKASEPKQYQPLFDAMTIEQYRELAVLMGIDARVAWNEEELREEILSVLTRSHHNKVTALWSEVPSYKAILVGLSEELGVPGYSVTDPEEMLEERIVQRVLAESIKKMTPEQLKKFESAVKANVQDDYWRRSISSTMIVGGLIAGKLSGFGLYVGASSALAAFGEGLGLTFAFAKYTALSRALSFAFGPIGISFATVAAALHWSRARPKKALPFVLYMAAARGHLESQSGKKMSLFKRFTRWWRRVIWRF